MGGQKKLEERPADEQPRGAPEEKPPVPRARRAAEPAAPPPHAAPNAAPRGAKPEQQAEEDDDGDVAGGCCGGGSSAEVSRLKKQLEAERRDKAQVRQWQLSGSCLCNARRSYAGC
jgi:hypothetical protein